MIKSNYRNEKLKIMRFKSLSLCKRNIEIEIQVLMRYKKKSQDNLLLTPTKRSKLKENSKLYNSKSRRKMLRKK